MSREQWKLIRPGLEVSSLGRARRYIDGHIIGGGYVGIPGGRRGAKRETLHALVAEAFLGPRPPGAIVRHRDDDPQNNKRTNLAYGTRQDNAIDAIRNGRVDLVAARERMARIAPLGGNWWKGKKRAGRRGKAIR